MITFDRSYNYVEAGSDDGLSASVEDYTRIATALGQVPGFCRLLKRVPWPFNGLKTQLDNAPARVVAASGGAALDRKSRFEAADPFDKDILGRLLHHPPKDGMSDPEMMSAIIGNVVAGVGDIPTLVVAALYFLLKNPDKMKTLREELDQRTSVGSLSRVARVREAEDCPYLQAVFNETLRLHPIAPGILQRLVPDGGMEIGGQYVPGGVSASKQFELSPD